jgi:hypothetical protein
VARDVTVIPDGGRDKWVPPPWHAPHQDDATAFGPKTGRGPRTTVRTAANSRAIDPDRPVVLGFAIAPAVTGVVALVLAFVGPLSGSGSIPLGVFLVCVVQIVGYLATRNSDVAILSKAWLIMLVATAGLLPLVSLQASLLREPYVSMERHSATPSVIATAIVVLFLVVVAVWCIVSLWSVSEVTSLSFGPLALLVPALLGVQDTIGQRTALQALAEASLFAAGATVLAWSLPRRVRSLVPPIALATQVALLWAAGRGPSFPETNGNIVTSLYWITVIATAALIVVAPVVSASLRRAIEQLEEAERPRRRETDGGSIPK